MIRTSHLPRSARSGRLLPRLLLLNLLLALTMQLLGLLPHLFQRQLPAVPVLPEAAPSQQVAELLARLPLAFEPAPPQIDGQARFQARALGGTLFFAPGEVLLARPDAELRVQFLDTEPTVAVEPADLLPGRVSRFLGDDPALWQQDLPTSAALVYRQLFPGIDLRYDGASRHLKGTYLLAAGADPARIRWRYNGATSIQLDPSGDLRIALDSNQPDGATQTLAERAPVAWQDTEGGRVPVAVAYDLAPDGSVGFQLGQYDQSQPLTIDPTLEFSTYLGGNGDDFIHDIALDAQGNIYLAGYTDATNFPVLLGADRRQSAGGRDVVVLKLSRTGTTLLSSTYLGGAGTDWEPSILVDERGITVVGNTTSTNFPTTLPNPAPNGDNDIFVTHLDTSGTRLLWSRYLSGSDYDIVYDAELDAQGRVTLVGTTRSTDFPAGQGPVYQPVMPNPPQHSPVVAQLSADGATITFRTFLIGPSYTYGKAIELAADGSIVIAGGGGPTPGNLDVFAAKLAPGATRLVWSTTLGGQRDDGTRDLALDSAGGIYITGTTLSRDFPGRNLPSDPTDTDGFLVKLSPDGQTRVFSQFETGNGDEDIVRVRLDAQGNIYLLGTTTSTDITRVNQQNIPVAPQDGNMNILLVKLSGDGQTVQSRLLLGGNDSSTDAVWALAVTPTGRVVLGGFTYSPDLPLQNELQNRLQPDPNPQKSPIDAVLMIIDTAPQLLLAGASNPAVLPACAADPCQAVEFTWTLDVPYRLDTTLVITLPKGLEVLPGSVSGATLSGKTLRSSDSVQPGSPKRISYQARAQASLKGGSMLTTLAQASTPGGSLFERSLTLALPKPLEPGQSRTLVLIYASGDNNLRDAMLLLATNAERAANTKDVVALLVLDGPGADDAYLYKLQPPQDDKDCFERLRDPSCRDRYKADETYQKWPDSLASPDTLADFLVSAQQAFPATRRVLSLVGHGGGWGPNVLDGQPSRHGGQPSRHGGQNLGGMLWDDNPESSLSTSELAAALSTSQTVIGSPFDLLYLDACNMGQIEVAYQLRGSARFLLASPNWKWAAFPYDKHLADATAGDGAAIGRAWIANEQQALAEHADEPYTYTLLDLSRLEELRQQVNTLAESLKGQSQAPALRAAFRLADRYDGNQDGALDERDTTIDLGSFAARLAAEFRPLGVTDVAGAAEQVQQTLKSAVVQQRARGGSPWLFHRNTWQWSNDAAGLAIYLPLGADDWRRRYYRSLAFGKDNAWTDLINLLWDNAAAPSDPVCGQPCNPPFGPQLRPVFLPLIRR